MPKDSVVNPVTIFGMLDDRDQEMWRDEERPVYDDMRDYLDANGR
jgi:hypothetical protein